MEHTTDLHIKHTNDFKYYVIQFLEIPNEDINEIVCIPWMWIVSYEVGDLNVVVSYPVLSPSDTEKRVKDREKHSKEWKLYKSVVIYATDSYEDAKHFSTQKMNEINYKYNQCSNIKYGDHETSASVEKRTHRSERSANSNQKKNKPLEFVLSSKNDGPALKRSKVVDPAETFNSPNENQSSQAFEKSSNSSVEPRIIASREFFTEFFTLLRDLQTTDARDASMIDMLHKTWIQNAETMRKVAKLNVDSRASIASCTITPKASTSKATTAEVDKISEKNNKIQKEPDDDDHEVANKKRSRFFKAKFVLPPEYDKNDSRWTLKHRELAPGLIELIPHTSVYINAVKLSHCLGLAKDCRSLARMLAVEIFTESAMVVCSFTGSRAKAYDVEGAPKRPGLDENARTVIMTFVQEYAKEKNWITVETESIRKSLRCKLLEMRMKYYK